VENGLHGCLDAAFREDQNRTRDTNAGANLGVVRRVAASPLKQDKGKGSIKAKRLNAAWNPDDLEQVLRGFQENKDALTLPASQRPATEDGHTSMRAAMTRPPVPQTHE
jgi:RNase P/RNase MRP subunit p30